VRRIIPIIGTRGAICEDTGSCSNALPDSNYMSAQIATFVSAPELTDIPEHTAPDSVVGFEEAP
jgi:hypothetical protein